MKQGCQTGSDFIEYNTALDKGMQLISQDNTQKKIIGLYIVVSINLGLRISDILRLTWDQLRQETFTIQEKKTSKQRTLAVNQHIKKALSMFDNSLTGCIFTSQKGSVYKIQSINVILKEVFAKEAQTLKISSHSCRKTFARTIYEKMGKDENSLIFLSDILNHSNIKTTKTYMGIRREEINNIYHLL